MPVNSDDPQFLASEVFRDTLLSYGVDEQSANNARKHFLALKKDKYEETQDLFYRIASNLQNENEASLSGNVSIKNPPSEFSFMVKNVDAEDNFVEESHKSSKESNKLSVKKKKEFKFILEDLLSYESGMFVQDKIEKEAAKMGLKLQAPKEQMKLKYVLHHHEISMFVAQQKVVLKRYLVLTPKALVVYKDQGSFASNPLKPWMIVPLSEIHEVELQKASEKRDYNLEEEKSIVSGVCFLIIYLSQFQEQMWLLEVKLTNNYSIIAE